MSEYLLPFSLRHVSFRRVPFRRQTVKCTVDCNRVATMDPRNSVENVLCRRSGATISVRPHFRLFQLFSVCKICQIEFDYFAIFEIVIAVISYNELLTLFCHQTFRSLDFRARP